MNTLELLRRVSVKSAGYGHYHITILFRNKVYTCVTTNSMAVDSMRSEGRTYGRYYVTAKKALLDLWNECKSKNNL